MALGTLASRIVSGPAPVAADFGAQPPRGKEVVSTVLGGDWEFLEIRPPRWG